MGRKPKRPTPLPVPKSATILEAAREIPTASCFRLWCVLAVVPRAWLTQGERRLSVHLGMNRNHLRKQLRQLADAGYLELHMPAVPGSVDAHGRKIRGRIVISRPPCLVGDDQFIRLGRPSSTLPGPFTESRAMTELRRRISHGKATSLLGTPRPPDPDEI